MASKLVGSDNPRGKEPGVIETYSGHYEYWDHAPHDGWCHLWVYEERGAPAVIITEPCPHSLGRAIADGEGNLARRVFAHLIPYARDRFRWFERSTVAQGRGEGRDEQVAEIVFASHDSSGGWTFTARHRTPTTSTIIEALIGRQLAPIPCAESDRPPQRFRTEKSVIHDDDPWYLPPDTPIPTTFRKQDGQAIRTIPKVERARRLTLLEEKALERRRQMLGY